MHFLESFFKIRTYLKKGFNRGGCKGAHKWILIPLDENQASCFLRFLVIKLS